MADVQYRHVYKRRKVGYSQAEHNETSNKNAVRKVCLQIEADDEDGGGSSIETNNEYCSICDDGGDMICCDGCPSSFHLSCMGLEEVPTGNWYCPNCRCTSCGRHSQGKWETTSIDWTLIVCDLCECKYHAQCLRFREVSLASSPREYLFCGEHCKMIFEQLRRLVGMRKPMKDGFSSTLLRSGTEDDRMGNRLSRSCKKRTAKHERKLSIAFKVMQECFDPIIDPLTNIDIISHVLYNRGSDVSRLDHHGFHTILLEKGNEVIAAATIRLHGARFAEMPFIWTRFKYRKQGMSISRLMNSIQEMLISLGMKRLVLPSAPETVNTWIDSFGFQRILESDQTELKSLNIVTFCVTSLLSKQLENMMSSISPDFSKYYRLVSIFSGSFISELT